MGRTDKSNKILRFNHIILGDQDGKDPFEFEGDPEVPITQFSPKKTRQLQSSNNKSRVLGKIIPSNFEGLTVEDLRKPDIKLKHHILDASDREFQPCAKKSPRVIKADSFNKTPTITNTNQNILKSPSRLDGRTFASVRGQGSPMKSSPQKKGQTAKRKRIGCGIDSGNSSGDEGVNSLKDACSSQEFSLSQEFVLSQELRSQEMSSQVNIISLHDSEVFPFLPILKIIGCLFGCSTIYICLLILIQCLSIMVSLKNP